MKLIILSVLFIMIFILNINAQAVYMKYLPGHWLAKELLTERLYITNMQQLIFCVENGKYTSQLIRTSKFDHTLFFEQTDSIYNGILKIRSPKLWYKKMWLCLTNEKGRTKWFKINYKPYDQKTVRACIQLIPQPIIALRQKIYKHP